MDDALLLRIADALDRMAPSATSPPPGDLPAYAWRGGALHASTLQALPLDLLHGIDAQRDALMANTRRHAAGHAAHDALLWGARGAGKSALVKACVAAVQAEGASLAIIDLAAESVRDLPSVFAASAALTRPAVIFIDDLGFGSAIEGARALRSVLDGGGAARPASIRLYVTSNRRHVVAREMAEQESAINVRDVVDDRLALADRFGLSLGFHACDQDAYLAMVIGYARKFALPFDAADAVLFATQRGSRSGRVAWHYIVDLAGRNGRAIA